jgi:hypothetical protein
VRHRRGRRDRDDQRAEKQGGEEQSWTHVR